MRHILKDHPSFDFQPNKKMRRKYYIYIYIFFFFITVIMLYLHLLLYKMFTILRVFSFS